jgi:hypothetical protein
MPLVLRGILEVRSSRGKYVWMGIYLGSVPQLRKYAGRRVCVVVYFPEECPLAEGG